MSQPVRHKHRFAVGLLFVLAGVVTLASCGGGGSSSSAGSTSSSTSSSSSTTTSSTVANEVPVAVNLGPTNDDANMLFVSVTVCVPGTTTCQTIPNVQVDTGSEGLRILSSALSISLPAVTESGNSLAECVTFADNSFVWGPIATADIEMAGEKASSTPVQIIGDANFPGVPSSCNTGGPNDDSLSVLGAEGLIGVGVFQQDCGSACSASVSEISNDPYYTCDSSGICSAASVSLTAQLQNPVSVFTQNNNGVMISLPSVPSGGSATLTGSMYFGIGTESNNALGSAKVYTADDSGYFSTTFEGTAYPSSFLDTGSNGLYFLSADALGIPECSDASGFYCPSSPVNYTATNTGQNGTSGTVSFTIANADTLFNSGNSALGELGGDNPGAFDWGLPFFYGRNVFVAIQNQSTPAGDGPYWAY